jgi:formate-dependent phosphoribosylglycinamide formyltransferase (GAR transformylase)
VLLLATTTGYQIRSFGEAADAVGVGLLIASDRCDQLDDPWWDGAVAVRFHDSAASVGSVLGAFGAAPPDGIIAVGDRPTVLAAHLASAFGLEGNSPDAAEASRNKLQTRARFRAAGLPTPRFRAAHVDDDPSALARDIAYPAVLKPSALSASRGVMRVDTAAGFREAFERLRTLLRSPDIRLERDAVHEHVVIEDFISGAEYAVDGVLTRGAFQPFALFEKPDPLEGPFFEETIYVTPPRLPVAAQQQLIDAVAAAARALGLHHGAVHAECRLNPRGVFVLELAARPIGGLCSKALRFHHRGRRNIPLEEVLLRHAVGQDVSEYHREPRASGVMMVPIPRRGVFRGVEGVEAAGTVAGIEDVRITAKPDTVLVPLPEGRSYLGFIFARGDDPATVEQSLRGAHALLRFRVERDVAVAEAR